MFAAYAYDRHYNNVDPLPDIPNPAAIDLNKDLLWGSYYPPGGELIDFGTTTKPVSITLEHLFSMVQVKIVNLSTGNISGAAVTLDGKPTGSYSLNVTTGAISYSGGPTDVYTFGNFTGSTTITSAPVLVWPVETPSALQVKVSAITIGGNPVSLPVGGAVFTFNSATLQKGKTYTLTIQFNKDPRRWAGSNVYWDGSKLTFDPVGTTTHERYEGVFFRWGSLVGIAPTPYAFSNSQVYAYQPNNPPSDYGFSKMFFSNLRSYSSPTTWYSSGFAYIYTNNTPNPPNWGSTNITDLEYLNTHNHWFVFNTVDPTGFAAPVGDICQYIGQVTPALEGYRMPTIEELGGPVWSDNTSPNGYPANYFTPSPPPSGWTLINNGGSPWNSHALSSVNDAGTTEIFNGYSRSVSGETVFFPAGGMRGSGGNMTAGTGGSEGEKPNVRGVYWSSSSIDLRAFILDFGQIQGGFGISFRTLGREYGAVVRCIRD
jgi:hypothetical protein